MSSSRSPSESGSHARASASNPAAPSASMAEHANLHVLHMLQAGESDQSAHWLTHFIQELWPYASNIVQFVLQEYVEPALKAAMPIGLPAPRFTKIDIGTEAVKVHSIHVHQRKYARDDIAAVIEADISYEGNPDIQMSLSEMSFGVSSFGVSHAKLNGRIEILLRPLLPRIPLLGAFQLAFINPPELDYNLTGLASLANQSFLRDLVRTVVDNLLAQIAVLPNRIVYKGVPDTDYFHFSAQPVGILRVAAISGQGFPATDRNVFKQALGRSELPDVYLMLTHGATVVRTKWIDDQASPVWKNEVFDFALTSESAYQEMRISAYDYDLGSNDDFLGSASVLVSDLIRKGVTEVALEGAPENATPTVKLVAKWLTISSSLRHLQHAIISQRDDQLRPKGCSHLLLSIEVDEAHHLPAGIRPYVKVTVGPHEFKTSAAYDLKGIYTVEDPEFEQSFHVSLQGPVDASLKIEFQVIDQNNGDCLGTAFCSFEEAIDEGPEGKIYNFALLRAKQPNATLRVRVKLAAVLDEPPLWKVFADPSSVREG